jgi:streptogramin lyase
VGLWQPDESAAISGAVEREVRAAGAGALIQYLLFVEDTMRSSKSLLVFLSLALLLVGCVESTSASSAIREFSLATTCGNDVHGPAYGCNPTTITSGPDGNLWFTEAAGNKIGRITPAGRIQEFSLPTTCNDSMGCSPTGITAGPDGNLWFTEATGNRIGRITPTGSIQEFPLPTTCPQDVTGFRIAPIGNAMNVVFARGQNGTGLAILPRAREVAQHPGDNDAVGCHPAGITSGPDGNLWFTETVGDRIGRITPVGSIQEFLLPTYCGYAGPEDSCGPNGITSGPDGNLWFTETSGEKIGRITPAGSIQEFALPTNCGDYCYPTGITSGPDGNLWFTESAGNRIGRMTPAGSIQEFSLPTTCHSSLGCGPTGITSGPDGALWFTEAAGNQIGRITPAGRIQEFPLPTTCNSGARCGPAGITRGPAGALWFAEATGNQIGQMSPQK